MIRAALHPRRGIGTALLLALCVAGAARIAAGAWVPAKAVAAQILLDRAFDRSLALHRPVRPWPWADMAPAARISAPRIGTSRIVLGSGSGQAMAFGPALLPGGAAFDGAGVTLIAAHRDTHFQFLRELRRGDLIVARTLDGVDHRYRVTGAEIVRWDRFALPADANESGLALVTCYPFDAIRHGPLRYVVWAVPTA